MKIRWTKQAEGEETEVFLKLSRNLEKNGAATAGLQ